VVQISISEKVAQWNHHYRKVDRKTKKCEKVELYDLEPETQLDLVRQCVMQSDWIRQCVM